MEQLRLPASSLTVTYEDLQLQVVRRRGAEFVVLLSIFTHGPLALGAGVVLFLFDIVFFGAKELAQCVTRLKCECALCTLIILTTYLS